MLKVGMCGAAAPEFIEAEIEFRKDPSPEILVPAFDRASMSWVPAPSDILFNEASPCVVRSANKLVMVLTADVGSLLSTVLTFIFTLASLLCEAMIDAVR